MTDAPAETRARPVVAVIGGGPAGLMAAEVLGQAGVAVTVFERMPSVGRKFLMAGRGGLNLTHSEDLERFLVRYGPAADRLGPLIEAFPPAALTAWGHGLGQETFVGSSGRVFPTALKASPLLRAWLRRLEELGVEVRTRAEWLGWDQAGALLIRGPDGIVETSRPDATILALGGASWAKLGSDGRWAPFLAGRGVPLGPFRPANSGFLIDWSPPFADRFAGQPLKNVGLSFDDAFVKGEAMVTRAGIEGGAVYALSSALREAIERDGRAELTIDLRPDQTAADLAAKLARPRKGDTMSTILRKAAHLPPVAIGLLREGHSVALPPDPAALAAAIKAVPALLTGIAPIDRAISTAGGVALEGVGEDLSLKAIPGVWVAGEMLDWEAPTGGYLLQACFATGVAAARGVLASLSFTSG